VKLIGICIEGHARSLVYELIRNGSVESHLHGMVSCQLWSLLWAQSCFAEIAKPSHSQLFIQNA
jgi:hypothetical protein